MIWVRLDRSCSDGPPESAIIAVRVAGSEVMVTRPDSIRRSALSGSKCAQTWVPPTMGTAQNASVPARWNIGAQCSQTQPGRKSMTPMQSSPQKKTLPPVRYTPFGSPVVLEV